MSKLHIAKDVFAFLMVGLLLMLASEETMVINDTAPAVQASTVSIPKAKMVKQVRSTLFDQQSADCFVVNYPIEIVYPNGHSKIVLNHIALDKLVDAWFENHPNANKEPTFSYPFEITMQNGRKVAIINEKQFLAVADACDEQVLVANYNSVDNFCFNFIYPMQLIAPNGSLQRVNSDNQVDLAIRKWTAQNPNSMEELAIQFPIKIKFDDGITIKLEAVNALSAAIQYCEDDSLEEDTFEAEETIEKQVDKTKKTSTTPYIGA